MAKSNAEHTTAISTFMLFDWFIYLLGLFRKVSKCPSLRAGEENTEAYTFASRLVQQMVGATDQWSQLFKQTICIPFFTLTYCFLFFLLPCSKVSSDTEIVFLVNINTACMVIIEPFSFMNQLQSVGYCNQHLCESLTSFFFRISFFHFIIGFITFIITSTINLFVVVCTSLC